MDIVQTPSPRVFIHFSNEPPHRNAGGPDNDVNDSGVGHNQAGVIQSLRYFDERRHPEALVMDSFVIEKIVSELLLNGFAARVWDRIAQYQRREHQKGGDAASFHLSPDNEYEQTRK